MHHDVTQQLMAAFNRHSPSLSLAHPYTSTSNHADHERVIFDLGATIAGGYGTAVRSPAPPDVRSRTQAGSE